MKECSVARLRELLTYDPKTGIFTWKVGRGGIAAGARAGSLRVRGCREISVDSVRIKEHRIAWAMMTGKWPATLVDHRDRRADNNAWDNLREADHGQNTFNRPMATANRSGFKGVFFHPVSGLWQARIRARGVRHYLGYFKTPEAAHAAYVAAAEKHHGEFACV